MNKAETIDKFIENIEVERKRLGYTQAEFAEKLDLSLSAYRKLISGVNKKIDVFVFVKLYDLTGKFAYEFLGLDDIKQRIVSKLNHLSKPQLSYVNAVIEYELLFNEDNADYEDFIAVHIPLGNVKDGMLYDTSNIEYVNVAKYRKKYGDKLHFGIKLPNNNFAPAYNQDDILLCSKDVIKDGDIGIFVNRCNEKTYIRKYEKGSPSILQPVNHFGTPFEINEKNASDYNNWIFFGKILCKMR